MIRWKQQPILFSLVIWWCLPTNIFFPAAQHLPQRAVGHAASVALVLGSCGDIALMAKQCSHIPLGPSMAALSEVRAFAKALYFLRAAHQSCPCPCPAHQSFPRQHVKGREGKS